MQLEILVEEPSAEAALRILVPRVLEQAGLAVGTDVHLAIHQLGGKAALLRKLPQRLTGYRNYPDDLDLRVLVLVDRDDEECRQLKQRLEVFAVEQGLPTRARSGTQRYVVCNRIVVEELEAWFIGDPDAVVAAYPNLPLSFANRATFREPDAVKGGTWETLQRLLQRHRYHQGGLAKVALANAVAPHMDPARNRSPSFRAFRDGLVGLVTQ